MSTLPKSKEKTREEKFLDDYEKNFGREVTLLKEKSLKEQNKQIEEFHLAGKTSSDFDKSIGVDTSRIDPKSVLNFLINPKTKSASSPFGFGGMSQDENGQFIEQQPGILAGLLMSVLSGNPKTAARMDVNKLLELSQIQKQQQAESNTGVYSYNPIAKKLEKTDEVPKGSIVRNTQVSPEERAGAYGEEQRKSAEFRSQLPTTEMKNTLLATQNQIINIDMMEKEAESLTGGWQGTFDYGKGLVSRGEMNPNELMYMRKVPAVSAGLYRALTGDNRLSDKDAGERARPLMWDVTLSPKLKKPMFSFLREAFQVKQELLQSKIYGGKEIPLNKIVEETNKRSTIKVFIDEAQAKASRYKGEVIINGKRARID